MFVEDAGVRRLDCGGRVLRLDRPRVVGIVNVTPDSFSDGGDHADTGAAVAHGLKLLAEGADMLDIGGESTRPDAADVDVDEELRRVVPVLRGLAAQCDAPLSVDTSKPAVMRAAVEAGAGLINDVRALREDGALDAAAALKVPVCLMHMQGAPRGMQSAPAYDDVVGEVHRFLAERVFACEMAGMDKRQLLVDPGFGFGKTLEHNLELLRHTERFVDLAAGVYVGLSRKSMIGALTGRETPVERMAGSVAAALIAVQRGAMIVRTHDVAATVDALAVWRAVHAGDRSPRAERRDAAPRWPDDE
ncbi:dihydropteroate synthase [Oleiagrimonas soli]|uniref:Dihydropteroate synthase n=1 Tax=Oleiagrimonas soli TaxID=1543381 RepID=A0A099CWR5_9GAMM|nr:dihydropteroate synthase [Oleiagrimonas soli]KGI78428.1 dihydropteroate synthase [Oleiagrimonas soli]